MFKSSQRIRLRIVNVLGQHGVVVWGRSGGTWPWLRVLAAAQLRGRGANVVDELNGNES